METTEVITEIQTAISALPQDAQPRLLAQAESEPLYRALHQHFVNGADRRWWWEDLSLPYASIQFAHDKAYTALPKLVPNANDNIWWMVEDVISPTYPIYEATANSAVEIIGNCFAFEYYLIAKDMSWMVCENHHGTIIGVGDTVIESINDMKQKRGTG